MMGRGWEKSSHKPKPQRRRWGGMLFSFLAVVGCLLTVSCDLPGKPTPTDEFVRPQEIESFATLFGRNCAGCHGADGKLGPAPPLNDPLFLALVPVSELERAITHGRAGTPMPAFAIRDGGELRPKQIRILAEGLKAHWASAGTPARE